MIAGQLILLPVLLLMSVAGQFPALDPPQVYSERIDHKFTNALNAAMMITAGQKWALCVYLWDAFVYQSGRPQPPCRAG